MSTSTTHSAVVPSFIDTASCLCGLLKSGSSLPNNGLQTQLWRCIGDASAKIDSGNNGKWYNTSLPSEELSGIARPQNWGDNPPDLSQVYVLHGENGKAVYEKLGSGGSPDLIGKDADCTGKNDTKASAMYYAGGNSSSSSTMSSSASLTAASTSTTGTAASTSASTTSASDSASSATGEPTSSGSTSSSTSAPTGTSSSAGAHFSLSSALLMGMVAAPLISMLI